MNRDNGQRPRRAIDHWETVEMIHSSQREIGRDNLGIVIEIQRPVFEDGGQGRLTMSCAVHRGERALRLFCRDGDTREIRALEELLSEATPKLEGATARFDEICNTEEKGHRKDSAKGKPGEPGGGLSRFSKVSKRDRKQLKKKGRTTKVDS